MKECVYVYALLFPVDPVVWSVTVSSHLQVCSDTFYSDLHFHQQKRRELQIKIMIHTFLSSTSKCHKNSMKMQIVYDVTPLQHGLLPMRQKYWIFFLPCQSPRTGELGGKFVIY